MKEECDHESVTKLEFRRESKSNPVHGPYYDVYFVECRDCGEQFEDSVPRD